VVLPIQIVKPGANLTGGRTLDLASDLIFFDLFEPRNRGGAMIAENPPRPVQSRRTSCHVFSALVRQQGHQDILYRSASESRFGRRERKRGKQIDPRNRPNCQVGSKPLCLLSCRTHAATQCTSTLRVLLWVSISRFQFVRPTNPPPSLEFSDIPGDCHSCKPSAREFSPPRRRFSSTFSSRCARGGLSHESVPRDLFD
jgi:hypothetical protein